MPLNKPALKASIKAALLAQRDLTTDPTAAADTLAGAIADAVDAFVKTAQVDPGILVVTNGSATTQSGATTAPGTLS